MNLFLDLPALIAQIDTYIRRDLNVIKIHASHIAF